jgi:hypothetical protein
MASVEKLNNKVKVSKFWAMGGICQIELWPDLPYMLRKPCLYYANSTERLREVEKEINDICDMGTKKFGLPIFFVQMICSISFYLDGFKYECRYGSVWYMEENEYLYIKERCYR